MSSKKLNYLSYGNLIDGTNYCSGVETVAENLIEDDEMDSVIVFPSENGWASLRTESYRMTTDNAEAILPLPIYKITKIIVNIPDFKIKHNYGEGTEENKYTDFKDLLGNSASLSFDITNYVKKIEEWSGLPIASLEEYYVNGIYKDNTFYWEEGSKKLQFLGTVYKRGTTILGGIFSDDTPSYQRLLKSVVRTFPEYGYFFIMHADRVWSLSDVALFGDFITDVRNWLFRIEYVPISTKTKMRARKSEYKEVEYIQPFNQRAEINAASAFGKNMYLTAQKTGTKQITIVKNYTSLADVPPLGALVKHNGRKYRLTANSYRMTNTVYIQVTHTLSENWTSKSKHVSVNQKYRNWNIPQDTLWRNLYWEDYIIASDVSAPEVPTQDADAGVSVAGVVSFLFQNHSTATNGKFLDTFAWYFDSGDTSKAGVTVPLATYGIGNSMIFSASFKDQLSAGLSRTDDLCEEALYCQTDGTLESASVILSSGITQYSGAYQSVQDKARDVYPTVKYETIDGVEYLLNEPQFILFAKTFKVLKDAGEAIRFTYQVHFIAKDNVVIGNKLAEHNPLVKKRENTAWDETGSEPIKVWLLKHYVREGADKLENTDGAVSYDHIYYNSESLQLQGSHGVSSVKYQETYSIALKQELKDELTNAENGYVAWAITDDQNNIYVACNENERGRVYFKIMHKR